MVSEKAYNFETSRSKSKNYVRMFFVFGAILVFGLVAAMIALRIEKSESVAPNAPESQPLAACKDDGDCGPKQECKQGKCKYSADGQSRNKKQDDGCGDKCVNTGVPRCGVGLYCDSKAIEGSSKCFDELNGVWNCCPSGKKILNGKCVTASAPDCGVGLNCDSKAIEGSSKCFDEVNGVLNCCPSGKKILNGKCVTASAPDCGVGLYCDSKAIEGSSKCFDQLNGVWNCCPSGKKILNGKCEVVTVSDCGDREYCPTASDGFSSCCALKAYPGTSKCYSGYYNIYSFCCPKGQKFTGSGNTCK